VLFTKKNKGKTEKRFLSNNGHQGICMMRVVTMKNKNKQRRKEKRENKETNF
jgi:hypothetical protein